VYRGDDGIRTRDLRGDNPVLSTLLSYDTLRTQGGIRTLNLRALNTAPLPVGLPGHTVANLVDKRGLEPLTSALQERRSTW
jgi:hypothetical protein